MKRVPNFNKKFTNLDIVTYENMEDNNLPLQSELYTADKYTNLSLHAKKPTFNINKFVYSAVNDENPEVTDVNFTIKQKAGETSIYYFLNLYYLNCKYKSLFSQYQFYSIFNLLKLNILSTNDINSNSNLNINWLLNNKLLIYRFKTLYSTTSILNSKQDIVLTSILTNNFTLNLNIYNYTILSNKFRLYFKSKSLTQSVLKLTLTKNNWFIKLITQNKKLFKLFTELYNIIQLIQNNNNKKIQNNSTITKQYLKKIKTICKFFFKKKNSLTKNVRNDMSNKMYIKKKLKYRKFENKILNFFLNNKDNYRAVGLYLEDILIKKTNNNYEDFKYFNLNKKLFYKMKKRFKLYKIFIKKLKKLTVLKQNKNINNKLNIFKKLYKYTNVFLNYKKPYILKKEEKVKFSNVFISNKDIKFTFNLIQNLPKKNIKIINKFSRYFKHYNTGINFYLIKHKFTKFNKFHNFFKKKWLTYPETCFLKKLKKINKINLKKINPLFTKYINRIQLRNTLSFRRFRKYFKYLKKKLKWRKRWNTREEANWYTFYDKKRRKSRFIYKAPFKPHLHEAKFSINKKYLIFNINKNNLINSNKSKVNALEGLTQLNNIKTTKTSYHYNLINKINFINLFFNDNTVNEYESTSVSNNFFFKKYFNNKINFTGRRLMLLKFKNVSNLFNKTRLLNKIIYQNYNIIKQSPILLKKSISSIDNIKLNYENNLKPFKFYFFIKTLNLNYKKLRYNSINNNTNNRLFYKKMYSFYKNIFKNIYIKNNTNLIFRNIILKKYLIILNNYSTKFNNVYLNDLIHLGQNYNINEEIKNNLNEYNLYKHILYKKVINCSKLQMNSRYSLNILFYNFETNVDEKQDLMENIENQSEFDKYLLTDVSDYQTLDEPDLNLVHYNNKYIKKWFINNKSFFNIKCNKKHQLIKFTYKNINSKYNFFLNFKKFKYYRMRKVLINKLSLTNKLLVNLENLKFKFIKFKKSLFTCSFFVWKKNFKFAKCSEIKLFYNVVRYTKYFKLRRRRYKKLLRRREIYIFFKRVRVLKMKWIHRKNFKNFNKCFFKPSFNISKNSNFELYLLLINLLKTDNTVIISYYKQVLSMVQKSKLIKNEILISNLNCILESKIFLNYILNKTINLNLYHQIQDIFTGFNLYKTNNDLKNLYNLNNSFTNKLYMAKFNKNNYYINKFNNKFNKISYKSKLETKFYIFFKKYFLFKKNNNKIFKFELKNKKIPYYKYQRKFKPSRIIFKQPRRILNNATKLQYKILINSERYKNKYFSVSTKNIYIRNSKNWIYRKALNTFDETCDYFNVINVNNTKFHNFFVDFNKNRLLKNDNYRDNTIKKNYSSWWQKLYKINKLNLNKYKKKYKALMFYNFSSNPKYYYSVLFSLFTLSNSNKLIKNLWFSLLLKQKRWAKRYRRGYFHRYTNYKFYNYNIPVDKRFVHKFIPEYHKNDLRRVMPLKLFRKIQYVDISKFSNYLNKNNTLYLSINKHTKQLPIFFKTKKKQIFDKYIFKNFYKKRALRQRFMIRKIAFFPNEKSKKMTLNATKKYNYIQYRNMLQLFKNSIYFKNILTFIKLRCKYHSTLNVKKLTSTLFKKFYIYLKLYKLQIGDINWIVVKNFKNFINKYNKQVPLNFINTRNFKKFKLNYKKPVLKYQSVINNFMILNKYFQKINTKYIYTNFTLSKNSVNKFILKTLNKVDLNYNLINVNSYITKLQRFRLITTYSYKLFLNTLFIYPSILILTPYLNKNYNNYLLTINKNNKKWVKILKSNLDDRNKSLNFNFYFFNHLITSFVETKTSLNVSLNIHFNNYNIIPLEYRIILNIWTQRVLRFHYIFKWAIRLKIIMKLLYLVTVEKDLHLLMKIITKITPKIQYRSHRRFFKFIIFIFRAFFVFLFLNFNIKGMQFEFAGKISVTGNARTRKMYYKLGKPSRSTYTYSTKYIYKTVSTYMGVLGIKVWIFY